MLQVDSKPSGTFEILCAPLWNKMICFGNTTLETLKIFNTLKT